MQTKKLLEIEDKAIKEWHKIQKEYEVMDDSDCGAIDEGENTLCDETLCQKHRQMYESQVAEAIIKLTEKELASLLPTINSRVSEKVS